jgi:xanthine/CO dehydrogenase XdhC/CoxF family maturation factor
MRRATSWARSPAAASRVVTEALDVIESGKPKTLEFGVADETAWKVGLSCGGTIRVFVEKVE